MTDVTGSPASPTPDPRQVPLDQWAAERTKTGLSGAADHDDHHHTPGTMALTLIFLLSFAIYYFANWKALADVWHVR
jgi:hypothetical protein